MQKSLQNSQDYQKLLPAASQLREDDDPDKLPQFGQSIASDESGVKPDELDAQVEALIGKPTKKNMQAPLDAKEDKPEDPKVSMI